MAKISVSIPDDLADELREEAVGNVSRFVSSAVRDALDRRRLTRALEALDLELGPVDADLLDEADVTFAAVEAANGKRAARAGGASARAGARVVRSRAARAVAGERRAKPSKASVKQSETGKRSR